MIIIRNGQTWLFVQGGKHLSYPQTQGKGATPLFLCVKTKTASRTNCSPHVQAKELLRCFLEKGGECYSTVARRRLRALRPQKFLYAK